METNRSVKAAKLASKIHSINPIEPDKPDMTSPSSHPFYDMGGVIAMACSPAEALTSEKLESIVTFIEKAITASESWEYRVNMAKARSIALKELSDRMLFLAGACQSDPVQVKQYFECFERFLEASEREEMKATDLQHKANKKINSGGFDKTDSDYRELLDLARAAGRKDLIEKLENLMINNQAVQL